MSQTPDLPRREQNKQRTRQAILRAARARFAEVGIANARMDEIAERAEVSRATLFNYFPGKTDIVAALTDQMNEAFYLMVERYCAEEPSVALRIRRVFTESAREMERRVELFRPLLGAERNWSVASGAAGVARLTDSFVRLLGGPEGAPGVRQDIDLRHLAEIAAGVYVGLVQNWRLIDGYPLQERLAEASRLVAEMVAPR
jgi:AcrR family transcriptional regulator